MAAKHIVRMLQTFKKETKMGALVVDGREVSAAKVFTQHFAEGDKVQFHTKKDALAFVKAHGNDKAAYIGKE